MSIIAIFVGSGVPDKALTYVLQFSDGVVGVLKLRQKGLVKCGNIKHQFAHNF